MERRPRFENVTTCYSKVTPSRHYVNRKRRNKAAGTFCFRLRTALRPNHYQPIFQRICLMYGRFGGLTRDISPIYGTLTRKKGAFGGKHILSKSAFLQKHLPYISEKPADEPANLPYISEIGLVGGKKKASRAGRLSRERNQLRRGCRRRSLPDRTGRDRPGLHRGRQA